MNPVHTMNSPPQNSFAGPSGGPFSSNIYSGYASSMAFMHNYAQQELSSQSTQAQYQHLMPPSNSINVNSAHTAQPTSGTNNGLSQHDMDLLKVRSQNEMTVLKARAQPTIDLLKARSQNEMGSPKGQTQNQSGSGLLNTDNLARLKGLIAACRANPTILDIPELSFFKDYLESYNKARSPDKSEKEKTIYVQKKSLGKSCKIALSPIKPMTEGEDYLVQRGLIPFQCLHCGKGCNSLKNLKRHMVSHTGGDGTYKCNICDKIFAYSSSLEYHMKAHKGVKPYPCPECGKAFSQKNRLQMHMRTHTGERPYKCNLCDKSFRQYNACTTHMLTHTEERPFPCNQCDKFFKNKDQVNKHIKINHMPRERSFKCVECGKGFFNNNNLRQHMKKVHTEGDSYECTKCDCYFKRKKQLSRHILRYHTPREKNFKCTECDKAFYHNGSLKIHMKKHPEVQWEIPEDKKEDSNQVEESFDHDESDHDI